MLPAPDSWPLAIAFLLPAWVACAAVHELGHLAAGRLVGVDVVACGLGMQRPWWWIQLGRVTFFLARPITAGMNIFTYEGVLPPRGQMICSVAGGPLANLALAIAAWLTWTSGVATTFSALVGVISMAMFFAAALPIRFQRGPLSFVNDGGQILLAARGRSGSGSQSPGILLGSALAMAGTCRTMGCLHGEISFTISTALLRGALGDGQGALEALDAECLRDPRRGSWNKIYEQFARAVAFANFDTTAAEVELASLEERSLTPDWRANVIAVRVGLALDRGEPAHDLIVAGLEAARSTGGRDLIEAFEVFQIVDDAPEDIDRVADAYFSSRRHRLLAPLVKLLLCSEVARILAGRREYEAARKWFNRATRQISELAATIASPVVREKFFASKLERLRQSLSTVPEEVPLFVPEPAAPPKAGRRWLRAAVAGGFLLGLLLILLDIRTRIDRSERTSLELAHASFATLQGSRNGERVVMQGYRNRLLPDPPPTTKQQFGYSATNHAGGQASGEIGGRVERSTVPASYGMAIPEATLDEAHHASGRLAVTAAEGGSGAMIGWFHVDSRGWRTPNSLAFRVDGNGGKYWLFYEYGTRHHLTGGGGAFEGDRYQTTATPPFPTGKTTHAWSLDYTPNAPDETGRLVFQIDDRRYEVVVPPEHKRDGATMNRFGIWNVQIAGDQLDVYLDDLVVDGKTHTFDVDPQWIGTGNDVEFAERIMRPFHDYGKAKADNPLSPGAIGGVIFRDEQPSYYGSVIEPRTLDDALDARGRLALVQAASDSGVYLGWFDAKSKRENHTPEHEARQPNLLALLVEGPSRIGHYVRPALSLANRTGRTADGDDGWPVIRPDGSVHRWELSYRPNDDDGGGTISVALDDVRKTFPVTAEERKSGAHFDRFGLFNLQAGGHHVEFYVDELRLGEDGDDARIGSSPNSGEQGIRGE